MPAFIAKAWKNSRTSSVSKVPIFCATNSVRNTRKRPARDIDGDARQRLVHRQIERGIAGNACLVAERLPDGLAQCDATSSTVW